MELIAKTFDELTTAELYAILKARMEVFVVEQACIYQDLDDRDQRSLHVFYERDGKIAAYLRAFVKDADNAVVQLGRVLTTERGKGYGASLLHEGIRLCRERMGAGSIFLEAQCYAVGFYEKEGFHTCSEPFLDDGIPHVEMVREFAE